MTTAWPVPAAILALGVIGVLAGARPASAKSEWLGWAGTDPVTVRLLVDDGWMTETLTADYHLTLYVRSELRWVLVWDPVDTDG